MSNPFDRPTITFRTFDTLRGAPLPIPLVLVEPDELRREQFLDRSMPYSTDVDGWAVPGDEATFQGPWRACTPGLAVDVEVLSSEPGGTVYVQTSADGSAVADTTSVGNVQEDEREVFRFTPSTAFYRVAIAPPSRCRIRVVSQQRA